MGAITETDVLLASGQEIKKAMSGLLDPVIKETYKGRAEVRDVFKITKVGTVAGCYVLDGLVTRGSSVRVLRDNVVVHTGKIDGLRRFKGISSKSSSETVGATPELAATIGPMLIRSSPALSSCPVIRVPTLHRARFRVS